jgi:hypothetical protein
MKRIILLIIVLIFSLYTAHAIDLKQTTDIPDTLYIGIPFYIHLSIPAGVDSLLMVVPDSLPNFQILEQKITSEKDKKEFIIKAAAFEVGKLQFPPLKINLYRKVSTDSSAISPFTVNVRSVLPTKEEPKLRDIAGPLNIPWTIWNYLVILLFLVFIGAIVYLVLRYLRRKKGLILPQAQPVDSRPSWQVALEELESLQNQRLLEQGDFLLYHFGLSMILRRFLENYIRFNAVEMTTSEIHEVLQTRDFPRWVGIIEFLQQADTVKFAKHIPANDESEAAYRWLYMYLKSFSEMEQAPVKENSNA